ncbi:MAG: hypothetical protein KKD01_09300 [Proteobacteria bacterium]|nr:hypothetical protein [Pseudomonadota bacterium]MBU1233997.1 hypothetical protein [Pseudomonadota bacterium]MBU1419217.1 hypothetical protein [Pseudomonadota bacterium]MBU1454905.1 hypothetical protein [Pseudomonadota bacterium]
MEPLTMFAATVGFIGFFHLLSTAVEHFGKRRNNSHDLNTKREEWYCFFQPSDLLGEDLGAGGNMGQHPSITDAELLKQRRQQQANRPRLQA